MIEKIVTSKTRVKLLKLFLTNIDNRYYLRELERMLDESLSPLRRQLIRLEKMEILITEQEANLKYYRLNRNFDGIEELRKLVLGQGQSAAVIASEPSVSQPSDGTIINAQGVAVAPNTNKPQPAPKRVRYDIAVLTVVSFFVLATAVFVVYTSTKNIKQVADLVSVSGPKSVFEDEGMQAVHSPASNATGEMASRRWKLFPGSVPVFSDIEPASQENGEKSKEL